MGKLRDRCGLLELHSLEPHDAVFVFEIISNAVKNNNIPPAILKAGKEITIELSVISPKIAKNNKIADAMMTDLLATRRRSFVDKSCVKEKKLELIRLDLQ